MALFSALEDFLQRSLAPLPSIWEKLRFVSGLREGTRYRHWGLEQKFGEVVAQRAMCEAHAGLAQEVASARLSELWLEADQAAHRQELAITDLLQGMSSEESRPEELQGVAPEHFNFVMANLYRVARSRSMPTRSAA